MSRGRGINVTSELLDFFIHAVPTPWGQWSGPQGGCVCVWVKPTPGRRSVDKFGCVCSTPQWLTLVCGGSGGAQSPGARLPTD